MSEFEAQEIKARIALRGLEEKTKLVKVVKRKGNILTCLWPSLVFICWTIAEYLDSNSTNNSSLSSFITIIPLLFLPVILGSVNHRLNSLVKLLEIDKQPLKKEERRE